MPTSAVPCSRRRKTWRTFRRKWSNGSTVAAARCRMRRSLRVRRWSTSDRGPASTASSPPARWAPRDSVHGVDMTDQMLAVARDSQPKVAAALGYDAVEFHKGYLEQIPLDDGMADVVTSNCVVNLSADKPRVLREIWRVLKDHGRTVIADIVSDRDVPPKVRADGRLWGQCLSGALTEEAFLSALERAGFYGVGILKKTPWREIDGCRFFSVTVRRLQVREAGRLPVRRPVRGLPGSAEGGHRRGRPSLPARRARGGVHRHGFQAVEPAVRRLVRHRRRSVRRRGGRARRRRRLRSRLLLTPPGRAAIRRR